MLIGATVDEDPAAAAAANPVLQVHPAAPPFLIRHGRLDRLVPAGQSVVLADALRAAGVEVDFQLVDGADHVFGGHPDPARFIDEAIEFLQARFERSGPVSQS
jgi:acetyl esterase/lipase